MKRGLFFTLMIGVLLSSCKKDNPKLDDIHGPKINNTTMSADLARTEFSKILSKAIYNEPELRQFIKTTAINQFDNDYDVFYALVKNEIVKENISFKNLLLKYAGSEQALDSIELALPLLNIYVPDLTMFTDFNAETWNVSDKEVSVTPLNSGKTQVFYGNGENLFTLPLEEVPGFPCLVVKDNERLKVKDNIKVKGVTSAADFEFIDAVFDKKLNTKGVINVGGVGYGYRDDQILYPTTIIKNAFNEFGIDPVYWQRDHVYYNLTKNSPKNGVFNPQVREFIHKIKLDPNVISRISDQPEDPRLAPFEHKSDDRDPLPWAEIVRRLWTDGNFELKFLISKGKRNEVSTRVDERNLSVNPRDLFQINQVKHQIQGGGIFHRDKHTYSVESLQHLEGKWYSPYNGAGLQLEQWDIANESMTMSIFVEEMDPSEVSEREETVVNKYANSNNFKIDLGLGGIIEKIAKLDLSYGYTSSHEETKTERVKWTTTHASDKLGNATFYFSDPILKYQYYRDVPGVEIYDVYSVGTGSIDIILLPKPF